MAVPTLHVRNVPPDVYEALRERAKREGRSINDETIVILREELARRRTAEEIIENLERLSVRLSPGAPTPEQLIREDRDARS